MAIYQRASVTVDENFARFGSKSYAINKITSVDVRDDSRDSSAWIFLAIFAVIIVASETSAATPKDNAAFGMYFVALALAAGAFLLFKKRRTESYTLMLATAAGEVQATQSPNREAIIELRRVLERRIAGLPD